jgi:uncharacterized radical SAM superfamily protein
MVSPKAPEGKHGRTTTGNVRYPISGGSRRMGKKTSEKADDNLREFKVGDRIKVNMHRGRIVEAEIKAVIEKTHGVRLQVSFGDETTRIH